MKKMKKSCGSRQDSLRSEEKRKKHKQHKGNHSITGSMPNQLSKGHLESQNKNPFLFLSQFLLLSMELYGIEYPFDQSGSVVQAVSPPNFLPTPSLPTRLGGRGRSGKKRKP